MQLPAPTVPIRYTIQLLRTYDTIRYDTTRPMSRCAQKLTSRQLNLPHRTKQKRLMKKLKIKTEMLRRNGSVMKPWIQSCGRKGVYGWKGL